MSERPRTMAAVKNALEVVHQAAESKPDDPIYRLVLAMLRFTPTSHSLLCPMASLRPRKCNCEYGEWIAELEFCAREIEAGR
jgi:hypothetical protein